MTARRFLLVLIALGLCSSLGWLAHAQGTDAPSPDNAPLAPPLETPAPTPDPFAIFASPAPSAEATPIPSQTGLQGAGRLHRQNSRLSGNRPRHGARAGDVLAQLADADPLEVRVNFRRDKTEAMARDPGLATLLDNAASAPTDREKRVWLRQYYDHLFTLIQKIDPSPTMKAHVDLLSQVAQQRYDPQRRSLAGEEDLVNGRGHGRRH